MPFEVKVESEKLLQQFEDMQKRVAELGQGVPETLLDWQREDMNRKYPTVDEKIGGTDANVAVTTLVYPRSRRVRPVRKGLGRAIRRKQGRRVLGGKRPILRPFLVEMLFRRMVAKCKEAIQWR